MSDSPRERRQERTYNAILHAAIAIITERGPDKLSLREIARRVDYSPAALYEYFDSKEDIIDAVCGLSNRRLYGYLARVSEDKPLKDYLLRLGQAYIQYALDNPELFTLAFSQLGASGGDMPKSSADLDPQDSFYILLNVIERKIETGEIQQKNADDAVEIAYGFWAVVHGLAVLQLTQLKRVDHDFGRSDMRTMETYIKGLLAP